MKPLIVHIKLPDSLAKSLAKKAHELSAGGDVRRVILDALWEQWFPAPKLPVPKMEEVPELANWPIFGSIPAEQKRDV